MAKQTPPKKVAKKSDGDYSKYISWFWRLFAGGVTLAVLLFLLASWNVFGTLPTFEELENPESNLATKIISVDGKQLGTYYNENRTPIKYDQLPQNLVDALVATEDERYYEHSGIDFRGTARAMAYLGKNGGASTVTQQLSKLLFSNPPSSTLERLLQKAKEYVIATRLERQYTKQEIIAMYLNKFDFLFNAIGISSAARIYFNKDVKDLDLHESAVFVAMLKNPRQYNPYREISKEKSLRRRNQVFKQMEVNGMITTAEKDSLTALPMEVKFTPEGHADGTATYFRENLKKFMASWIKENPKGEDAEGNTTYYNIYRDGLTITTTIDSRMQKMAEDAVAAHMPRLQAEFDRQNEKNKTAPFRDIEEEDVERIFNNAIKSSSRWRKLKAQGKTDAAIRKSFDVKTDMTIFTWAGDVDTLMTPRDSIRYYKKFLRTGMMSMVPQTGEVRAWVGGINMNHFQYDHVQLGKRQVGSTFKPFLYATAVDQLHLSPCDTLPNTLYTIPAGAHGNTKNWTPENSGGEMGGMITMKEALAQSVNTISARLMDKVGPQPVLDLVSKLGIDTKDIPVVPSIALGTADLSVYEMVSAYGAFANQGVYVKPQIVSTIQDKNGTVLYQHVPETRDVLSAESAYVTLQLMEGVTRSGSGARLRHTWRKDAIYRNAVTGYPYGFDNAIAGKTGTTQNQSDGWFMGIVPNLVTGVWVGGDDRAVHFPGIGYGQGATMALPIWGMYMKEVYKNEDLEISKSEFSKPSNLTITTNCDDYKSSGVSDELPDELDF
ncbi:penicillin-binding protein 1A [Dokdonia sp. Hel_I_63]|uniref:penicillin-binding protein 1A n=1 Tax=unclassified Dokdonia TaxID=2615033 RepID=UPI00020A6BB3|nr:MULTISPECIES: transglycosylase domain-containing protein [unclassified Dokdonia]AEE19052.1 Peptidoglycan glycosyltransferase [Dokdonia sp. 4H-3-7-5]TVZ21716.1 penicillin-binding protein 1A [Dokdonia sp. Hel_I_63]